MDREAFEHLATYQDKHWWHRGRRDILSRVVGRLPLPEQPRILEAGCGTGGNIAMLSAHGTVSAFEPDPDAARFALEKSGNPVQTGALPDGIPFDKGAFDLVTAFDVMEHLDDDVAAATALLACLKPGGYGVFTVPAFQFLWSGHDELHQHRRRYRRKQLAGVLTDGGFEPVFSSYFNAIMFPAVASVRLIKRAVSPDGQTDDKRLSPAFLDPVLYRLLASERFLIGKVPLPVGTSALVVAKRPE